MLPCLTDLEVAGFLTGNCSAADQLRMQQHLQECPKCRERVEAAGGTVVSVSRPAPDSRVPDSAAADQRPPAPPPPPSSDVHSSETLVNRATDDVTGVEPKTVFGDPSSLFSLGRYEVLEKLGEGGMGLVFKARHSRMKRIVALKILPPEIAGDKESVLRFRREVEVAARLSHPNIAAAYDADESKGTHFLVMEFVDGPTLSALVKSRGAVSLSAALDLTIQAARGLAYAHEQGVVHRDIKPANLMVAPGGRLKILDMGVANLRYENEAAELTHTGRLIGTVDYMAPEQATDARAVDGRADIYSLGCTLFYLLAGRAAAPPGSLTNKLLWYQEHEPPPLTTFCPDVDDELEAVFRAMVARDPAERIGSMQEVAERLEPFQRDLPADPLATSPGGGEGAGGGDFRDGQVVADSPDSTTLREQATLNDEPALRQAATQPARTEQPTIRDRAGVQPATAAPLDADAKSAPAGGWRGGGLKAGAAIGGAVGLVAVCGIGLAVWLGLPPRTPRGVGDDPNANANTNHGETGPQPAPTTPTGLAIAGPHAGAEVFVGDRSLGTLGDQQPTWFELTPGEHTVEIRLDGFKPWQRVVAVRPGRRTPLTVTLDRKLPHEEVLRWVFAKQGKVHVTSAGGDRSADRVESLPNASFSIRGVDLRGAAVRGDELQRLAAVTQLQQLSLAGTKIGDAGLSHLAKLHGLWSLDLSGTNVTNGGLVHLARLSELRDLSLQRTAVTDPGLAQLSGLVKLEKLVLSDLEVGDIGVPQLARHKRLTELTLHGTLLTEAGHRLLTTALPDTSILWDGPDIHRAVAGKLVSGGARVSVVPKDEQAAVTVRSRADLPRRRFVVQEIDASGVEEFGDPQLKLIGGLPGVQVIRLGGTGVTAEGLRNLAGLKSLKVLSLGTLPIPETVVAVFQQAGCEVLQTPPADQVVARWALARGAKLRLATPDGQVRDGPAQPAELPRQFVLRELDLSDDAALTDDDLRRLADLSGLEVLKLAGTRVSDAGVARLATIRSLRDLDLGGTAITSAGLPAVGKLRGLRSLHLTQTKIAGGGLRHLRHLTELTHLSLAQTPIETPDLAALTTLTRLHWLDASGSQLDGACWEGLQQLPGLGEVNVTGAPINDGQLEAIRARLRRVKVHGHPLDPQRLAARWFLSQSAELSIAGENGPTPLKLADLPPTPCRIVKLSLAGRPEIDLQEAMRRLVDCPNLEILKLSGVRVREPRHFAAIGKLRELRELELDESGVGDDLLTACTELTQLKVLNLHGNRVTDTGLAALNGMAELSQLTLSNNSRVTDAGLASVARLKNLESLDLGGNRQLTDKGMMQLAGLTQLRRLILRSTGVTDAGLARLTGRLTRMQILDLSNTAIGDGGIAGISKMASLRFLDLATTKVRGLGALGGLSRLESLDLGGTMVNYDEATAFGAARGPKFRLVKPRRPRPTNPSRPRREEG